MAKTPFLNVKLEGRKDPVDPLVRAVTIEDNDRLVDEANLTFDDPDGNGANLFAPDKTLTVDLGWDGEHAVLFEAEVPVQRRGMVFLDDEPALRAGLGDQARRRLRCALEVALAAVLFEAVSTRHRASSIRGHGKRGARPLPV